MYFTCSTLVLIFETHPNLLLVDLNIYFLMLDTRSLSLKVWSLTLRAKIPPGMCDMQILCSSVEEKEKHMQNLY